MGQRSRPMFSPPDAILPEPPPAGTDGTRKHPICIIGTMKIRHDMTDFHGTIFSP
jgi:hypothetical protein